MTRKKPHLGPLALRRLFDACSRRELEMVARSCTTVGMQAGTVLVREGQTNCEFVLIVSGSVAVSRQGFPEFVLGSDEWFGDIELLSAGTSSATVVALTDVECIVMSRPEFARLFDAVPSFQKRLVRSLASIARDSVALSKVPRWIARREDGGSDGGVEWDRTRDRRAARR
jgi:CRP-like cAMP-binding protein